MEDVKTFLREYCSKWVYSKESLLQERIAELKQSLDSETKSSAGDKHETGRAMLHLELEKTARSLGDIQQMYAVLKRIPRSISRREVAGLGSLVISDSGRYYLAVSAGAVRFENTDYWCISTASPVGKALIGKAAGEEASFQNKRVKILEIF
ncbi:GreA/GreB family elongation factor [Robiginitalea sp. IMCC43444]|uniref:GreA/GreB family elongation factor n=1 Tax=Robiginitalea sp. IMCC43444 TaxID=3459121 RepID=UPI0040414AA4